MLKRILSTIAVTLLIIAGISLPSGCGSSSGGKTSYEDSIANIAARRMMENGDFILVADRLTMGRGSTRSVTPNTNFVLVNQQTGEATVQASPGISGGPNGVGGITLSGTLNNYRVQTASNGLTTVKFHLSATIGSADVTIVLEKGYNGATAHVSGDFTGRDLTLYGKIQSSGSASYFQGRGR